MSSLGVAGPRRCTAMPRRDRGEDLQPPSLLRLACKTCQLLCCADSSFPSGSCLYSIALYRVGELVVCTPPTSVCTRACCCCRASLSSRSRGMDSVESFHSDIRRGDLAAVQARLHEEPGSSKLRGTFIWTSGRLEPLPAPGTCPSSAFSWITGRTSRARTPTAALRSIGPVHMGGRPW
jgi:hypothetical protein